MNASLRDLRQHVDQTPPPPLDVEGIIARGDARLRRRRAALAAGSASLAVAAIVAVAALPSSDPTSGPPAETPSPSITETPAPTGVRPLTYTDDYTVGPDLDIHWYMKSIQYGDRTIRPGIDATALDLTDDGVVMVAPDGGIHFSDGRTTEKIGETTILEGQSWAEWGVKTSPAGSLATWFTPEGPERSLVVYDTHQRKVLAEVPRPDCVPDHCSLSAVVGDRVYYEWLHVAGPRATTRLKVLDVPTETVSETDAGTLSADLRFHPRGFVKGDNYSTGEVVNQDVNDEAVYFVPRGSTLELQRVVRTTGADIDGDGEGDGPVVYGYGGFDATGRRLNLQLPAGYTPAENAYVLFQWLDDDRFAVMAGATHGSGNFGIDGWPGYGDILVCDIVRERCTLAAPGPDPGVTGSDDDAQFRLVPHLTLPN
ncbi:hypothetical protein [Nocardioides sp.]|uniref:hypothetical protein n=1 Tax=Nocardioides sp. TaxID=35761 RepID=UPI002ED1B2EC